MNQPDRYSRFVLPSGVPEAVSYQQDTKMKAAGQFSVWLEDHTVGNLLRHQLLDNPEVIFAGYRIPHPLNPMMVVRIQTTEHSNPPEAMSTAIQQLRAEVDILKDQLQHAAPRDMHQQDQQQMIQQQQQQGGVGYAAAGGYDPYGAPPLTVGGGGGYGAPPPPGGYGVPPPGGMPPGGYGGY